MDAEGLGGSAYELHHGHGADGQHLVEGLTGLQQLLQGLGDQAVTAVSTVVGHKNQPVGCCLELVLQNDDVLAAETDDNGHFCARFLERLGRGQGDGAAHAAADHADLLLALHGGGLAQGAYKVVDVVAFLQRTQGVGGEADLLEDNGNGTFFPVITGDGQGNALSHLVDAENDELTGLCLTGDKGRFDLHQGDGSVQLLLANDFIHVLIRPFQSFSGDRVTHTYRFHYKALGVFCQIRMFLFCGKCLQNPKHVP